MEVQALRNNIFVHNMEIGEKTIGKIIIPSDDGKVYGVHPRWAQVYSVGPDVKDLFVGEWVLIEHGRWTRTITIKNGQEEKNIWNVDPDSILCVSNEKIDFMFNTESEFGEKTINHKYLTVHED